MKTLIALAVTFAFVLTAAHAQGPAVRQLVRQADFVGLVQAEPMVSDPHGEWKQYIFLTDTDAIKGSLSRNYGNNQYPWIKADHAGVAGYPTRFGENGEYLVFLHESGTGPAAKWTTLAAYHVQYYPIGSSSRLELAPQGVIGVLTTDTSGMHPVTQPVITVTDAQRWLTSLVYEQKLTPMEETKMDLFFQNSLRSKEEADKEEADQVTTTHEERLTLARKLAAAITPGMTRAQVEKIFPQSDGGVTSSDRGRYYFGSEVMIDVPFDTTGGPFQPENKVSGPLRVYQDMMHYD